jgi:ATP-dependent Clp protease adapter protein ClpS
MQFTNDEMKMIRWLRTQHAAWRLVRVIILVSSLLSLGLAAWLFWFGDLSGIAITSVVVAVYGLSYTLGSWSGRPEISLLLKLVDAHDPPGNLNLAPLPSDLATTATYLPSEATHGVEFANDNKTPMEFVVRVLEQYFGMERKAATLTMLQIHRQGRATVPAGSKEHAETTAAQTVQEARKRGYPLACAAVALLPHK